MTLIVETGAVVEGANSYISTANFTTYATARNYTLVSGAETLLIQAMDYLESQDFLGLKYSYTQALQWPRTNVVIDNWWIPVTTIPQLLIDAQCEIAMAIDAGESPVASLTQNKSSVKVGEVEVSYSSNSPSVSMNRKISTKLNKLIRSGSAFRVTKA